MDHYTPVNEPQISAWLSGREGVWPPYHNDLHGWSDLFVPLAKAMVLSTEALRSVLDSAAIISADCRWGPGKDEFRAAFGLDPPQCQQDKILLEYGPASIAYGRIDPGWAPARALGISDDELEWFSRHAQRPDVFGVNYYPVGWPDTGSIEEKRSELIQLCEEAASTFGLPVYITETSGGFTPNQKATWLRAVEEGVNQMQEAGVDIVGVNWWPLFDTIRWEYRDNGESISDCIVPGVWNNGLCTIDKTTPELRRQQTTAYDEYRRFAQRQLEST